MCLPTDENCRNGALVNFVQNASLEFAKKRGDYRGAIPFTFEQAQDFLLCMYSSGLLVGLTEDDIIMRRKKNKVIQQTAINK